MIRIALRAEHELLIELYRRWGYRAGIAPSDVVYVAEQASRPVGLVRRTFENGVTMLRGMQVDPVYQRQGVGSRLRDAFVADVRAQGSFCIPFAHLTEFYERGGFRVLAEDAGPPFLIARLDQYRREGYDVRLMCRAADTRLDRAG